MATQTGSYDFKAAKAANDTGAAAQAATDDHFNQYVENKTFTDTTIENNRLAAEEAIAALPESYIQFSALEAYMQFSSYTEGGQTLPLLILGSSNSQLQAHLRADVLQFIEGGQVVAYLSGRALNVQERLSFGGFSFYKRSNEHFTLKNV